MLTPSIFLNQDSARGARLSNEDFPKIVHNMLIRDLSEEKVHFCESVIIAVHLQGLLPLKLTIHALEGCSAVKSISVFIYLNRPSISTFYFWTFSDVLAVR